jgi:hypothetical protein
MRGSISLRLLREAPFDFRDRWFAKPQAANRLPSYIMNSRTLTDASIQPPPAPLDTSRAVLCLRCGYDLRGLSPELACPECGLRVERSMFPERELHRGRPQWLTKLSIGTWLILAVHLGTITLLFAMIYAGSWLPLVVVIVLGGMLAITHAVALLLLTWTEGRAGAGGRRSVLRRVLRLWCLNGLVIAWLLCMGYWTRRDALLVDAILVGVLLAPCSGLTFLYLRGLARRILDPGLAEHCAIVAFGTTASILAAYGMAVYENASRGGMRQLDDAFWLAWLAAAVMFFLFLIWSTLLLVWFALAFRAAAKLARSTWRAADVARAEGSD